MHVQAYIGSFLSLICLYACAHAVEYVTSLSDHWKIHLFALYYASPILCKLTIKIQEKLQGFLHEW